VVQPCQCIPALSMNNCDNYYNYKCYRHRAMKVFVNTRQPLVDGDYSKIIKRSSYGVSYTLQSPVMEFPTHCSVQLWSILHCIDQPVMEHPTLQSCYGVSYTAIQLWNILHSRVKKKKNHHLLLHICWASMQHPQMAAAFVKEYEQS